MHAAVGEKAAACADVILAAGRESAHLVAAARAAGMAQDAARHFEQPEQLGEFAAEQLRHGDAVLVKASRAMAFDRVVERILQQLR